MVTFMAFLGASCIMVALFGLLITAVAVMMLCNGEQTNGMMMLPWGLAIIATFVFLMIICFNKSEMYEYQGSTGVWCKNITVIKPKIHDDYIVIKNSSNTFTTYRIYISNQKQEAER